MLFNPGFIYPVLVKCPYCGHKKLYWSRPFAIRPSLFPTDSVTCPHCGRRFMPDNCKQEDLR